MLILRGPRKGLELTGGPEGWKDFLAEPDKHWKDGRSAKLLAEALTAALAERDESGGGRWRAEGDRYRHFPDRWR